MSVRIWRLVTPEGVGVTNSPAGGYSKPWGAYNQADVREFPGETWTASEIRDNTLDLGNYNHYQELLDEIIDRYALSPALYFAFDDLEDVGCVFYTERHGSRLIAHPFTGSKTVETTFPRLTSWPPRQPRSTTS